MRARRSREKPMRSTDRVACVAEGGPPRGSVVGCGDGVCARTKALEHNATRTGLSPLLIDDLRLLTTNAPPIPTSACASFRPNHPFRPFFTGRRSAPHSRKDCLEAGTTP